MEGRRDPYQFDVGSATIEPNTPVRAGSYITRTITITAGVFGSDEGSRFLVCKRLSCDMEIPQFTDPAASGYVTAACSNPDVEAVPFFIEQGYLDDWRSAIGIRIARGYLRQGDRLTVVIGDTSGGGPGLRTQTFPERRHTFKVAADVFNINHFYEIADSPEIEVVAGEPARIELVCPQTPVRGDPFDLVVRVMDNWGNPVQRCRGTIRFGNTAGWSGLPRLVTFDSGEEGVKRLAGVRVDGPGPLRLTAVDDAGRAALSPPVVPRDAGARQRLLWGDAHGQTRSTVGTGTVEEFYRFARDKACIDVASWQGNDLRVRNEDWAEVLRETERFNEDGRFVTLLGYEWSGLRSGGGDHNIYYAGSTGTIHRSSHARVEDYGDLDTDRFPVTELWRTYRGRTDVLAVAHVGGRCCNLDFYDPDMVRLIEVHSHHGTFEWLIADALERGCRVGFTAGSDDHTGRLGLVHPNRPGSSVATFDVKGGLMGVWAAERSRRAVFDAMRSRHTYGTSGDRILLDVRCAGAIMGDEIPVPGAPTIEIAAFGTAALLDVELRRGMKVIHRHAVNTPTARQGNRRRIRVQWSGVSQKSGRSKQVTWKGSICVEGGTILTMEPFALDQYDDRVWQVSNQRIDIDTRTSGDYDGVLLDVEAQAGSRLLFNCGHLRCAVDLAALGAEPTVFPGRVGTTAVLFSEVAAELTECDAVFPFTDNAAPPGCNPYWVRLSQLNGGQAWSSPIFVTRT